VAVQLKAHGRRGGEGREFQIAYESLIARLEGEGLIDRVKVGISGFSREGYHVEYALTHSSFPFAAAIAADNFDGSYFQAALWGWDSAYAVVNGTPPHGDGLVEWLKSAPGFNAERILPPLMIEVQSQGIVGLLSHWEIFSQLRALKKPVEMWVAPDLERGEHVTQNPRQILAIQNRVIDWFDFWLNGHENLSPAKAEQYAAWRRLREQRDVTAKVKMLH
jgi:dipeptidyl aminopeptidase/acylaminoacyl peptidase